MTKPVALPSRDLLKHIFRYDGKRLIWKNPPKNKQFLIGRKAATRGDDDYLMVKIGGRLYKVHRIIFKIKTGNEPPQIDHKNRKRDDNSWANLRASTHLKNHRNRTNTRYPNLPPGVDLSRGVPGRYRALGWKNGKTHHLGMFTSKSKATQAFRTFVEQRG